MANGKCRVHGGTTPKGIASPHFKTGRYSTALPGHLAEKYRQAQSDKSLIELRDEIALLDARIGDVLSGLDGGATARFHAKAIERTLRASEALRSGDFESAERSLAEVGEFLARVQTEHSLWREVYDLIERRRRLVETESRRLREMDQMISVEQAMVLVTALASIVRENVTDRAALSRIQAGLTRLVSAHQAADPAPRTAPERMN